MKWLWGATMCKLGIHWYGVTKETTVRCSIFDPRPIVTLVAECYCCPWNKIEVLP